VAMSKLDRIYLWILAVGLVVFLIGAFSFLRGSPQTPIKGGSYGTGAPSGSASLGDLYIQTDGTGNLKLWIWTGTWVQQNGGAPITFGTTSAPVCSNAGTTMFLGIGGAGALGLLTEASVVRFVTPVATTLKTLRVKIGGNVPSGQTAAFKVSVN